jgi:Tol biopolymer transport system component
MRQFATAMLLSVAATLVLAAPSEAAFPRGTNGVIAYLCGSENYNDICTINADGSGKRNLTNTPQPVFEFQPRFTPDGRRILFWGDAGPGPSAFEVMNADGSGRAPLRVADDIFQPALSPDGRTVYYSAQPDAAPHGIYAMNADGSGERLLTSTDPMHPAEDPTVSPDGETIAFQRLVSVGCCNFAHLFVMRPDGSGLGHLTTPTSTGSESDPAFGPDGRIVFVLDDPSSERDIAVINADGGGVRNLTNTPTILERQPELSPDGKLIAYATFDGDIWLMNADGSGPRNLTNSPCPPECEESPSWQPIQRCGGRLVTVVGDDGPDTLRGTKRRDMIMGFGGKDVIKGRGGNDRLCGGAGKDRLIAGAGKRDLCKGGGGKDRGKGCERGKV